MDISKMAQHTVRQIINKLLQVNEFSDNLEQAKKFIDKLKITPTYPIVLVGGTNGKGSTCAYLTNILAISGYKVGTFTSPHIFEYNERIAINNIPISNDDLRNYLEKVLVSPTSCHDNDDTNEYSSTNNNNYNLGMFKTFTLAAHLYFIDKKIDIAIIEVGLGGRKDVTNLFEPTISAITTVGFDHCHLLGNSLDAIGKEKAHIYRPNKWAFFGGYNPPQSVVDHANTIGAKFEKMGSDFDVLRNELSFDVRCNNRTFYTIPYPSLRGHEQVYNVALSLAILSKLQDSFPLSLGAIKTAVLQTKLIGRFQIMPGQPQIVFDVAHNVQAVQSMIQNMVKLPFAKNNIAVFGIASDKDVKKIIEISHGVFDSWYIARLNSERGVENNKLKEILLKHNVKREQIIECDNITLAMQLALNKVKDSERIICFGSFLTVEEAYKTYKIKVI